MISKYFTLEGKTFVTDVPEFCGWFMYPCGAVRNPVLLALKIAFRQSRGELERTLDSYYLEASIATHCGDEITNFLPPLALEAQRWVLDFCKANSAIVPHISDPKLVNRLLGLPFSHLTPELAVALSLETPPE
jgi:hypothetical protein